MENANYINRYWRITLYNIKWGGNDKKILTVVGNIVDVFYKIKIEMDKNYYSSFVIEEVE